LARFQNSSGEWTSGQVLVRFGLQTAVMVALSAFGSIDFNKTFAALMWTAIVFCITVAVRAGEPAFGGTLNHWDEAAAYTAMLALALENVLRSRCRRPNNHSNPIRPCCGHNAAL
jgi:hypothetical protein